MSTTGKVSIQEFVAYGGEFSLFYQHGEVAWALGRTSEVDNPLLPQAAERDSTLAVALGVDGEFDIVMMDENETAPLEAMSRAIEVLTETRDRLAAMLASQGERKS